MTWINHDVISHTVTASDHSFNSGSVKPGATFTHTFTHPATIEDTHPIHETVHGKIEVLP